MYVVFFLLLCVNVVMNFSYFFLLFILHMRCCMGVKASLTLGWEEMPWVKGLVGLNIEVERFSSWRGFCCSWSMGSIEAICLVVIMGGISVLM